MREPHWQTKMAVAFPDGHSALMLVAARLQNELKFAQGCS